ncbi:MAG: hypothetical protein IT183_12815 [Acidobacteria bacterium]|nr:hypothetical protein [Acidobacteriota bacterium]
MRMVQTDGPSQPLRVRRAFVLALVAEIALACAWLSPLEAQRREGGRPMVNTLTITIGSEAFTATLVDNPTASAFKSQLPLTVRMSELNGNEKLFRLPTGLPTQPSRPSGIEGGDLMLYGASTLVLFYKSFATTYSYTRIGRIDNPAGLERALGPGSVAVTFAMRQGQ